MPAVTASGETSVPTPSVAPAATAPAAASGLARGARAEVETDVLRATIDANGGDLRALQLLKYRETENKQHVLGLFEDAPGRPYVAQSGLVGENLPTHRSVFELRPGTYRLAGNAAQIEMPLI